VQKKKEEEEEEGKEKEKGRRPWAVVKELRSTVHVAEQWRHGAEEEEEEEGEGEGEGEGLVISLLQGAPLLLCCNTVVTKAAPSCFGEGEGEGEREGEGLIIPLLQGVPLFTVL